MSDIEKTAGKIRAYFKKWEWIVVKWGWKFDVNYCDCVEDMPEKASYRAAGITFCDWQYLEADIYINVKIASELSDEKIEYIVLHELTHLLLSPMQDTIDNVEMCATTIARVIKMASMKGKE